MTSRTGLLQGPDTDPTELGRFRTALARFRPVEGELLHVRKDGSPFWVRLRIMPVPDASGRYTHWVGVAREITARRCCSEENSSCSPVGSARRSSYEPTVSASARRARLSVSSCTGPGAAPRSPGAPPCPRTLR